LLNASQTGSRRISLAFTGAGDYFCAGMDLKEYFIGLKDNPREYERVCGGRR
jgi:enoyl-CoA hydratase/carnithine racemase